RTSLLSIRHRRRILRWIQRRRNRRLRRARAVVSSTQENPGLDTTDKIEEESEEDDEEGYVDSGYDMDDDDDDEEYDRNISALSGGSPSGELHFYLSSSVSQPSTSEEGNKQQMKQKKAKKEMKAGDGDVFDEEYSPVDVMTRLQSTSRDTETGMSEAERLSTNRARRDVIREGWAPRDIFIILQTEEHDSKLFMTGGGGVHD
ncbi:hypothetical protein TSMEX_010449, partial [Taenia solium]